MKTAPQRKTLSVAELRLAIEALSQPDLIRLNKKAKVFASGTGMEPEDILQEAVVRSLEENGGRNCPRDVKPVIFLGNVMRSIASHARENWAREMPIGANDDDDLIATTPDPTPLLEETVIRRLDCRKIISRIETMFNEDRQTLAVVIGIMEDWTPHEIREIEPMSDSEYAAARKRVRRAFQRESQKGPIHE